MGHHVHANAVQAKVQGGQGKSSSKLMYILKLACEAVQLLAVKLQVGQAHSVSPYPFLPRVVNSYFNTLEQVNEKVVVVG